MFDGAGPQPQKEQIGTIITERRSKRKPAGKDQQTSSSLFQQPLKQSLNNSWQSARGGRGRESILRWRCWRGEGGRRWNSTWWGRTWPGPAPAPSAFLPSWGGTVLWIMLNLQNSAWWWFWSNIFGRVQWQRLCQNHNTFWLHWEERWKQCICKVFGGAFGGRSIWRSTILTE